MSQLDYNDQVSIPAVKGGIADAAIHNIVSRESAEVINFGIGIARLSTGLVKVPSSTGDTFDGVSVQKNKSTPNATGIALYDIGEAISSMHKGRLWVYSETAVDPTLPVLLRCTANTGPTRTPGNFMSVDDSGKTITVANAKWASVTTAAGLAILEINLP